MYFKSGVSEKGNGYWKLNNSILQDKQYQLLINKLIDNHIRYFSCKNFDRRLMLDILKIVIRESTEKYCKAKSKLNNRLMLSLEKQLAQK